MANPKNVPALEQSANAHACQHAAAPVVQPSSLVPSPEESALFDELLQRIDRRARPLADVMRADLRLAESRVVHLAPDLNPYGHFQFLIRLGRELKRAEKDGTPDLFVVADEKGVTYPELIGAWVEEGQWITTQRGARVVMETGAPVMNLSEALAAAETVRERLQVAIDGNGSEPELAGALRLFVWDRRRTPGSRPAMLNHLGLATTSIRNLAAEVRRAQETPPDEVPPEARYLEGEALREAERNLSPWAPSVQRAVLGLERLLPRADQVIQDLSSAVDGRARPTRIELWSRPVQVLVGAIELMQNEFLRNAASAATDERLTSLVHLLAPRRGPDNVPVVAPDPEAPPAKDETMIPFVEPAEQEPGAD